MGDACTPSARNSITAESMMQPVQCKTQVNLMRPAHWYRFV
ncbi:hypothetical protein MELA_01890 [Candidatus Methylomirabilis lanthanidiphila]|uniref:Uncharacterized protein n=1 Tax=Candidatus Methylomirabilis lanthanidiphila TaxID=2211376 RepID=A0A564ZJK4_9BACT|nr:hypothetical protein MELA_01890 [Candidatus Methylomirabilis lanthanidiphila]